MVKWRIEFEIYRARDGFRWRTKARNGRIIAESGEAYTRKYDCEQAMWRLIHGVLDDYNDIPF